MKHGLLTAGLIVSVLFVIINAGYACPPQPPTAIIKALPEYVITGRAVTLDGSDSYPNPGIIEYRWDFTENYSYDYTETITQCPDGAFDGITTHAYTQAGDYSVMLLVIKSGTSNYSDIDTCTVHVCEDSDNDDLPDCWELLYGLDPNDANDADEHDDSDGYNNLCEYLHLSEPNNTDSTPDPNYTITIDVPANVNSIQRAIDACIDGDTVVVAPGRYVENLYFTDKKITLTAIDPNDPAVVARTIIDGDDANNVIIFEPGDANSTITGFTITNGLANDYYKTFSIHGGGIYCNGVSPTISNCIITKNEADDYGGGIYCDSASPKIINCTISENQAGDNGGGMSCMGSSSATITNCIFKNNVGASAVYGEGGGIYNGESSSITVTNCVFIGNKTRWGGGGIYTGRYGSSTIINCLFIDNYSEFYMGGASYNRNNAEVTLTNCILWDNEAPPDLPDEWTRQIYWEVGGQPSISYCYIQDMVGNDPCFVDPCDPDGPDDIFGTYDDGLMLAVGDSPCIDAGSNSAVEYVYTDITGNDRTVDGDHDQEGDESATVDMGPYEVPTIWFVDVNAAADGNGFSWEYAFDSLQDALTNSDINDGNEIWVADGTYKPTDGTDRTISFELIEGVRVYGGFDGNEVGLCQREWNKYPTVLSGDINEPNDANDNSHHVVVGADNAVLDGFTITGGNADGTDSNSYGGGIYYYNTSPVIITNCIIADNHAAEFGGGICSRQCLYPLDLELKVTNCVFADNSSSENSGGAVATWQDNTSAAFTNCLFSNNHALYGGAGIFFAAGVNNSAQLTNCTFYANDANLASVGGAIVSLECELTLANSIFWANTPDQVLAGYSMTQQSTFSHCDIQDSNGSGENWDSSLGIDAGGNIDADPNFLDPCDPDGPDDIWATADDGLVPGPKSPCINAASFWLPGPRDDTTSRVRRNVSPYPDIGAYESKYKIMLVMCFIDETQDVSYHDDLDEYLADMDDFNDLLAGFPYSTDYSLLKAGCIVPPFYDPFYPDKFHQNIADVLPEGFFDPCEPPEILPPEDEPVGISIAECNRPPSGAELIDHFHRIRDGRAPDCILRLADNTAPLGGFYGLGDGYDDFVDWLEAWLKDHGLDPADTTVLPGEKWFGSAQSHPDNERWIMAITEEVNDIVNP